MSEEESTPDNASKHADEEFLQFFQPTQVENSSPSSTSTTSSTPGNKDKTSSSTTSDRSKQASTPEASSKSESSDLSSKIGKEIPQNAVVITPPEVSEKSESTSKGTKDMSKSSETETSATRSRDQLSVPPNPVFQPPLVMSGNNKSFMIGSGSMYSRSMSMRSASVIAPTKMIPVRDEGENLTHRAYDRLIEMNIPDNVDYGLPEVPGPGSYGMEPKTVFNPAARMNAAKCGCIIFTALTVMLILMELIFIASTGDCKERGVLCKTVAGLAILVIILEWVRAWILQETSPMMVSNLYRSTVHETNTGMEVALIYVEPPQQNDTSPTSLYTKSPGEIPQSQIPRLVMKSPTYGEVPYEYADGGGFRGNIAGTRFYDGIQTVAVLILGILYIIGIAAAVLGVVKGKTGHGKEDECSETVTYPIINLALAGLRILLFIASPLFKGICTLCAGKPVEQTPLVVKTQNNEFINDLSDPPFRMKKTTARLKSPSSTEEL
ncbi:unnamed protein product [Schistocephalus solidus]|uniref:Conserved plasma membrane protein n=1 Tax=Schistocephalus solidus TaxID=70667 RepID=A0A0X3QBH0_SCHSO|nr:unnamed protein product [Schistocephalus solidus]